MNQQKQAPHLHLRSSLRKKRNCFSCDGLIGVIPQKESDFLSLEDEMKKKLMSPSSSENGGLFENAYFLKWKTEDVLGLVKYHPIPCIFAASLLFFMGVEYTLRMVPSSSPPFDLGFVATLPLHRLLASRPILNSFLAGLNTVCLILSEALNLSSCILIWQKSTPKRRLIQQGIYESFSLLIDASFPLACIAHFKNWA